MACESDLGVSLESIFAYDGDFVATLGSLGGHFWHLKAAWDHFGVSLGALAAYGGDFGAILGLFWNQSRVSLGICG